MFKNLWFIFVFTFVLLIFVYIDNLPKVKNSEIPDLEINSTSPLISPIPLPQKNELIDVLNNNCSKVRSIYYPKIIIRSGNIRIESVFLYEKEKNFRMINWSIFGKESDVGSNNEYFWFWSKRMKPSALFYAKHEDLPKTRLKTLFHPTWMMETIGINPINIDSDSILFEYKNYLGVLQNRIDVTNGKAVKRVYLIDKEKKAYYGHYLFDQNNGLIVSFEVYEHYFVDGIYVPKEVGIIWPKEKVKLNWSLSMPLINSDIDQKQWNMPNIEPKIDLKGYVPTTVFLAF